MAVCATGIPKRGIVSVRAEHARAVWADSADLLALAGVEQLVAATPIQHLWSCCGVASFVAHTAALTVVVASPLPSLLFC